MSTFWQMTRFRYAPAMDLPLAAALVPTLPLQIAERIGTSIVEERFAPGERLKEVELALAFGVSRATVREALRLLEKRGLVSILPQRGARVTELSKKELEELVITVHEAADAVEKILADGVDRAMEHYNKRAKPVE